jgi:DNA-binding NtrC family response regulator
LLRVLQEQEFERVGGNRTIKVDVRVIATTNRHLEESVERKEFRQDLFFRLNVVPMLIAPLRQRKEDIPLLAEHFRQRFARKHGAQVLGISQTCLAALNAHSWPGNVRELQNVIERAVILCNETGILEPVHLGLGQRIEVSPIAPSSAAPVTTTPVATNGEFPTLADIERRHILAAMERSNGNRTHAAKMLDISIRTLRNKLNDYGYKAAPPPGSVM